MANLSLAPQLEFRGDCRSAFEFYAAILGGKITVMNTFGDNKAHDLPPGSVEGSQEKIRFAELRFGSNVIRGNDLNDPQYATPKGFNLSLHVDNASDAVRIFHALATGGRVVTPLSKVDWADLFGMVTDQFGVPWLILAVRS